LKERGPGKGRALSVSLIVRKGASREETLVNKLAVAGAASLAALLLSSGGVLGELVISEPVRSVDNIPPEPVTNLLAVDTGVGVRHHLGSLD